MLWNINHKNFREIILESRQHEALRHPDNNEYKVGEMILKQDYWLKLSFKTP